MRDGLGRWRPFAKLRPREQWMCFKAFGVLVVTAWGLRCLGFNRCYAALQRMAGPAESPPQAREQAEQIWQLLKLTSMYGPYRGTCLSRSLALWWLLRRRGIETELRFGVRRQHNRIQAHAWVECQGRPLNAGRRVHERYAAFEGAITPGMGLKL